MCISIGAIMNVSINLEFNKMISDVLFGKIDLIITKSISRFAHNTLDAISYVRKLKDKGIEVFFEKENLWTLDPKSELILTIWHRLLKKNQGRLVKMSDGE